MGIRHWPEDAQDEVERLTKQRDELQRDYDRLAEALETEKRYTARLDELEEDLTAARNALLKEGMQRDALAEALRICADQFELYAEHHKRKAGMAGSEDELLAAIDKYHRNQLLAFNARKALEEMK